MPMMINPTTNQKGMTLIELMISMVVALIVIGGATAIFISTLRSTNDNIRSLQLNEELRAATEVMVAEIRRAGYLYNSSLYAAAAASRDPSLSVSLPSLEVSADGTCITYAYDRNLDGNFNGEHHGFRLGGNGEIEYWTPGADAMPACDDGENWTAITNPDVADITTFAIDFGGSQCVNTDMDPPAAPGDPSDHWYTPEASRLNACNPTLTGYTAEEDDLLIETRQVNLRIEAQHGADQNIRTEYETSVRVRNDVLIAAPAPAPAS